MATERKSDINEEHVRRVRRICGAIPETTEKLSQTFFKPPYVGVRGWVGIELDSISDEDLASHIFDAWRLVAPKRLQPNPPF